MWQHVQFTLLALLVLSSPCAAVRVTGKAVATGDARRTAAVVPRMQPQLDELEDYAYEDPQHVKLVELCLAFLEKHMPKGDRKRVTREALRLNVELALLARNATPWAAAVPMDVFLNDVLPYASLDEPRDAWRAAMQPMLQAMVAGTQTTTEAAQLLNKDLWGLWGIVFKPDQTPEIMSPTQVIAAGYASCTGLSIFLVAACRSVGIPARVAGTPSWVTGPAPRRGRAPQRAQPPSGGDVGTLGHNFNNHNWVEVWDNGIWSFVGAAEYDKRGVNRTWFFPQPAKKQIPGSRLHAIYAASFSRHSPGCANMTRFPLIWNKDYTVLGCDVTQSYLDAPVLGRAATKTNSAGVNTVVRVGALPTRNSAGGGIAAVVATRKGRKPAQGQAQQGEMVHRRGRNKGSKMLTLLA